MGSLIWEILKFFIPILGVFEDASNFFHDMSISIYQLTIRLWNVMSLQSLNYAAASPADAAAAGYSQVQNLASVLQMVSTSILTICLLYRFFKTFNENRMEVNFGTIIRVIIVMYICAAVTLNAVDILTQILSMGTGLCQLVGLGTPSLEEDSQIMSIMTNGNPGIPTLIFMIVFMVSVMTTGAGMMIMVVQRLLRILVMMPFAGMAIATIVGGGKVGEIGYSYLRAFGAYCLEGAVIILIISLGNGLVNAGLFRSLVDVIVDTEEWWGFFKIMLSGVCQMMGCSMIAGMVKVSDSLVHKMFGL